MLIIFPDDNVKKSVVALICQMSCTFPECSMQLSHLSHLKSDLSSFPCLLLIKISPFNYQEHLECWLLKMVWWISQECLSIKLFCFACPVHVHRYQLFVSVDNIIYANVEVLLVPYIFHQRRDGERKRRKRIHASIDIIGKKGKKNTQEKINKIYRCTEEKLSCVSHSITYSRSANRDLTCHRVIQCRK